MHPFMQHFEAMETLEQVSRDLRPDDTKGDFIGGLLSAIENESGAKQETTANKAALKELSEDLTDDT